MAAAIAILAAQTACGGGAVAPRVSNASQTIGTRGGLVYVSDSIGNFVDVFNLNGSFVGRLTDRIDYPEYLYVDARHNLYVANAGGGNVLVFRRGATKVSSEYRDVQDASAPARCASGTIYVAHGPIAVFARGHHTPTGSLSDPYGVTNSVSCDMGGNVFATATVDSPPGYVLEYPAGSKNAKLLLGNLLNPVDVVPDPTGNILVVDSAGGSANDVTEYTKEGSPTGRSMPTNGNWSEIAIAPRGKEILGADQSNLEGVLVEFPSGKVVQTYTDKSFKQLGGIAYDPG